MRKLIGAGSLTGFIAIGWMGGAFAQQPGASAPPPVLLKGTMGQWVGGGEALYKVVSHESGLKDYRQKYNQSGRVIHPGFSKDRMAVVEIEIKNVTDHPILPPVFMAALTDTEGARTTEWSLDARQSSFIADSGRGRKWSEGSPCEIGPGATMKVALAFSIAPKARPTMIEFSPENFHGMRFGRRPPTDPSVQPRDGTANQRREATPPGYRPLRFQFDLTISAKP